MNLVRGSEQRLLSATTFSVMLSVVRSFIGGISLGIGRSLELAGAFLSPFWAALRVALKSGVSLILASSVMGCSFYSFWILVGDEQMQDE